MKTHIAKFSLALLVKTVSLGLLFACAISLLSTPTYGADARGWTGDASQYWSNPLNWRPAGTPQDGEDLYFFDTAIISGPGAMVNDLTNLAVHRLEFGVNATFVEDWELFGNPLTITGSIDADVSTDENVHIHCGFKLGADVLCYTGKSDFTTFELHLDGPIDLNGHNLLLIANFDGLLEVSGAISGNGNVTVEGSRYGEFIGEPDGLVEFSGTEGNTFHGTLTVTTSAVDPYFSIAHYGNLLLNKQAGLAVTDWLQVEKGALVALGHSEQIGDNAVVELLLSARLQLNGHDETIGGLFLTGTNGGATGILDTGGGTLTLNGSVNSRSDSEQSAPAIIGRLSLPAGTHDFNISGTAYAGLDMQAQVVGSGGFSKSGSAALLLQASNTFNGSISVNSGVLDVRNNYALGDIAGDITLFGGSLTLRNVAIGTERLIAAGQSVAGEMPGSLLTTVGTCTWAGQVLLNTNLVIVGDMTFTGDISGTGGIGFFGGGTSLLGGALANTYTGTTLVRSPLVQFNKPALVNAFFGPLVVGGGAGGSCEARWLNSYQNLGATVTLYDNGLINLNNFNENVASITFNGGRVQTGVGQFGINQFLVVNSANAIAVINGFLRLPSPTTPVNFYIADGVADPDLQVNAVVVGTAPIVKQGLGTMSFTAANTYTGTTTVNQGILAVNNDAALGSPGAGTMVSSNATLELDGLTQTFAEPLHLSGSGRGGTNGALYCLHAGVIKSLITLDAPATIRCDDTSSQFLLLSTISGTGPLTKTGPGILNLGGSSANTYTGGTFGSDGSLWLSKPQFVIAAPGNLVLGPAPSASPAIALFFQTGEMGGDTVTANANSILNLNNNNLNLARLNLNDGGGVQTGSGILGLSGGGVVAVGSKGLFGSRSSSTITGKLGLPTVDGVTFIVSSYDSFPPVPTAPELDVPAIVSGSPSLFFNGLIKDGSGQMRLSANNTFPGQVELLAGRLRVDGVQPQSQVVVYAGTLGGTGTVGRVFMNGSAAVVAPGSSPGILTCSNFNSGSTGPGTLEMELNGTAPGSGYDQLNVHGAVNLSGIALNAALNFTPSLNDQFVIINNDGGDAVTGTFNGLPQGATLTLGGEYFQVAYNGGTGNDVVLTHLFTPHPVLSIQLVPPASVRLLWPTNAAGFSLGFNTNLATTNWTLASPPYVVLGTNNVVTNAASGATKLYRLIKP